MGFPFSFLSVRMSRTPLAELAIVKPIVSNRPSSYFFSQVPSPVQAFLCQHLLTLQTQSSNAKKMDTTCSRTSKTLKRALIVSNQCGPRGLTQPPLNLRSSTHDVIAARLWAKGTNMHVILYIMNHAIRVKA